MGCLLSNASPPCLLKALTEIIPHLLHSVHLSSHTRPTCHLSHFSHHPFGPSLMDNSYGPLMMVSTDTTIKHVCSNIQCSKPLGKNIHCFLRLGCFTQLIIFSFILLSGSYYSSLSNLFSTPIFTVLEENYISTNSG